MLLTKKIIFLKEKLSQRTLKVIKNSFWNGISKVTSLLIAIFLYPMVVKEYGIEKFGVFTLLISFSSAFTFADMGLGTGLQNEIPKIKALKTHNRYISSTFYTLIPVALILFFIVAYIFHSQLGEYFNSKYEFLKINPTHLIIVFLFFVCLSIPFSIVQKIQIGIQSGYLNSFFIIFSNIFIVIISTLLILGKARFEYVAICYFGCQTLIIVVNFIYYFYFKNINLFPKFSYYNIKTALFLLSSGIVFFLIQLVNIFGSISDGFLISYFISLKEVANYSIILKILQVLSTPSQIIIDPLAPAFNESLINNDLGWTNNVIKRVFQLTLIYTIFCGFILFFFAKTIIYYWIGERFEMDSITMLSFCLLLIPANMGGIFASLFNTKSFFKYYLVIITCTNLFTFVCKIIFVKSYGIPALNIIHVFFFIFFYLIAFIYIKRKYLRK